MYDKTEKKCIFSNTRTYRNFGDLVRQYLDKEELITSSDLPS